MAFGSLCLSVVASTMAMEFCQLTSYGQVTKVAMRINGIIIRVFLELFAYGGFHGQTDTDIDRLF